MIAMNAYIFSQIETREIKSGIKPMSILADKFKTCCIQDITLITHHSTAIEGNTFTEKEVGRLITDSLIPQDKSLREINEVQNHSRVFKEIVNNIDDIKISEDFVKNMHKGLMLNILEESGQYRRLNVRIQGASAVPPNYNAMHSDLKWFYESFSSLHEVDIILGASYLHAELVRIHPFEDGNGRTSRLFLNTWLMKNNYLPINFKSDNKSKNHYFDCLDYYTQGDIEPFYNLVKELVVEALSFQDSKPVGFEE